MHLKKKDWVLIAIIIVVAGLAFFLHNLLGAKGANCVVVKVDGKIEGTYSLGEDQEISINGGTNTLVIKNNRAKMKEADCPDQTLREPRRQFQKTMRALSVFRIK